MNQGTSKPYVIDYADEPGRLERQALLDDLPRFFERFTLPPEAQVLDAGCGSGAMTRLLARQAPAGSVTGVDTNTRYLAIAAQQATAEGITNITFQEASIFALPFPDHTFDLVWCKYVLQWVEQPGQAVAEFRRVTRPGGLVVCVHFDGFGVTHDPIDPALQADADAFFPQVIDPFVGRKQYRMFYDAGLRDIRIHAEADPLYTVAGSIDPARRENWRAQLAASFSAAVRCLGSEERAAAFVERFLAYHDREDTASYCTLYTVMGRAPRTAQEVAHER
jgi:ubiquinone/menaquinone biosynthesis C-methylase UbiE